MAIRDFEVPGRSLAIAKNGMAATSHPAATLVAVDILRAGGTAVDAAVGACAVQCVVEPGSTGIGGDCFALLTSGGSDRVAAYNGSGRAPAALTVERLKANGVAKIERTSPHAVTVPGAVEAWARLVADHGRMPLAELLAPAITLARDGYALTPRVARDLRLQRDMLANDPTSSRTFLEDGAAPPQGAIRRQPLLAETLEAIGRDGPNAFYRGHVAKDIVERLNELGGVHCLSDFETAAGEYVTPISTAFGGCTVHECPPNGQGIVALMILNILSRFAVRPDPLDVDNLHIHTEAARLAYAARDALVGDPRHGLAIDDFLLSDELADDLAGRINLGQAIASFPTFEGAPHRDTVYISVVDKDRNAVSFINSLFYPYGSGIMAPMSGVLLHNRGQSFVVADGHPNCVAPGKRPMHTIIPGMVTRLGRTEMSFGVMGGHYQAMGHAYFLSNVFRHGLDIQAAMELPRLFPDPETGVVDMEGRLYSAVAPDFTRRGFTVRQTSSPTGGAQAIQIDWENGVLIGASDHRKDGSALGY